MLAKLGSSASQPFSLNTKKNCYKEIVVGKISALPEITCDRAIFLFGLVNHSCEKQETEKT